MHATDASFTLPVVQPTTVRKRDGHTTQPFDVGKIENAVRKAWLAVEDTIDEDELHRVATFVAATLPTETADVELIQNAVEVALMRAHKFAVAKAYILYRDERAGDRATSQAPDPRAVSDYIHASKYARYLPEKQRRELFMETVARVEAMHQRRFVGVEGLAPQITRAFDAVREKRVLPSMRSMQFGGRAVEVNHNRQYNCLSADTAFITNQGVRRFTDFEHGDTVTVLTHAGNWKPAKVFSYGKQLLYNIILQRGGGTNVVRATRDHQWILSDGSRTRGLEVGQTLARPPVLLGTWRYENENPEARWYWAMGYVYGDGTCVKNAEGQYTHSMVRLCGDDGRFVQRFQELGFSVSRPPACNGDAMAYTGHYLKTLPSLEVDGFANVMAFARGYLDADGSKNANANGDYAHQSPFVSLQTSSEEAISFVRNVFPVLGVYITRERDLTGQTINYGTRPTTSSFGLVSSFGARGPVYRVQSIEPSNEETVWCLEVEDDHSFVLGNGVVTGNCSATLIDRPRAFAEAIFLLLSGCGVGYSVQFDHVEKLPVLMDIDEKKVIHHVIEDTIEGWANALDALISSYVNGYYVEFAYHLIRAAGTPLKTSGGRAPGHRRLKLALDRIRGVLHSAQGRKLRPIEAHRILCHAADAVLSGGIRRSAMICLFSLEDSELMHIKTDRDWYAKEPWLANANNSVVLKRDEVKEKQFKRIFGMTRNFGEPGVLFVSDYNHVTNPCFHPDTRLWTTGGYRKVIDLYHEGQALQVVTDQRVGKGDVYDRERFGVQVRNATAVALTQRSAEVFELCTEHGYRVTMTAAHEVPTTRGRLALKNIVPGDFVLLPSGEGAFGMRGTRDEGLLLGMYTGDGVTAPRGAGRDAEAFVDLWEDDFDLESPVCVAMNAVVAAVPSGNGSRPVRWYDRAESEQGVASKRIGGTRFYKWLSAQADHEDVRMIKQRVPEAVWQGSREFAVGYLQGLFATDGTLNVGGHKKSQTVSLRLCQANKFLLEDVQVLLGMFGVVSCLYSRRPAGARLLPDGHGGRALYECKEYFELVINRPNLIRFMHRVDLIGRKRALVSAALAARGLDCRKEERYISRVLSVSPAGTTDVYCLTQPETNCVVSNGVVNGQCAEIGLDPVLVHPDDSTSTGWAMCNLCEINASKLTSKADFMEAAWAATLIGTLQATYTDMPYLGKVTEAIVRRDALIGIGMTGMQDSPAIACNPKLQREVAGSIVKWNRDWAAQLGINSAARTTCVKPSGTTSLELGCVGSGIHPHHARRYIRRVTADELEVVFQAFKTINPHMCTKRPDGKWAIEFPVEAPDDAILKEDLSAEAFMNIVKSTQENWVAPGNVRPSHAPGLSHNVSNTITVRADEWAFVAKYLWKNRDSFTGVTLLADTADTDYAFAPNEAVRTEAQARRWNELVSKYQPVNYHASFEAEDGTTMTCEAACSGGSCAWT